MLSYTWGHAGFCPSTVGWVGKSCTSWDLQSTVNCKALGNVGQSWWYIWLQLWAPVGACNPSVPMCLVHTPYARTWVPTIRQSRHHQTLVPKRASPPCLPDAGTSPKSSCPTKSKRAFASPHHLDVQKNANLPLKHVFTLTSCACPFKTPPPFLAAQLSAATAAKRAWKP